MKKPRRNHSPAFKARIAKEALQGVKTINQIAQENDLHPVQVTTWKKELEENMSVLFERKNASKHEEKRLAKKVERLERRLGQELIEKEWLEKKCDELGIDRSEKE
jgi:transposase-like protein